MQSPYLAIAYKQAQIMTKAAVEMGFTPASRSRITLPLVAADDLYSVVQRKTNQDIPWVA
jgi:phage terminase small subunit